MKKELYTKRIFALLIVLFMGMGTAFAYDFSAVCSTGQTLYYNIIDATNHYVEIAHPNTSYPYWEGYTEPTGNITLPSTVTYNGITYTVKAIGERAFYMCSISSNSRFNAAIFVFGNPKRNPIFANYNSKFEI